MNSNALFQVIWGAVLALAGVGVFFRIPQVMPKIKEMEAFKPLMGFIYFSLYLLGVLLVAGGIKKIVDHHGALSRKNEPRSSTDPTKTDRSETE